LKEYQKSYIIGKDNNVGNQLGECCYETIFERERWHFLNKRII
jgi:hypothetical protein